MMPHEDTTRWQLLASTTDPLKLSQGLGVPALVAKLLVNRGINTVSEGKAFLEAPYDNLSDPTAILNMEAAIEALLQAMNAQKNITIYGDYDVDGICATVLMREAFRHLDYPVKWYIPSRFSEGYGMNASALEKLQADGTDVILTVDNGIAARDLIETTPELDFIVTDHHRLPEVLPETIILNPHLDPDPSLPFANLCGCGLAFMLARGLFRALRPKEALALEGSLLDLVAIATIADVVPLTGDNRILVRHGISRVKAGHRHGLKALMAHIGINPEVLRASDVAFQVAPRINACGRLDRVSDAVALLESVDHEEAIALAETVNAHNETRKELEKKAFSEALAQLEAEGPAKKWAVVVRSADWHPGVVGIVASRLTERFHVPSLVFTQDRQNPDRWNGSGRSLSGFDLFEALSDLAEGLYAFGGHEMAAGLTVLEEGFPLFKDAFERYCRESQDNWHGPPVLQVDASIRPEEISRAYYDALAYLEPYGCGNPEPVFLWENARLSSVRRIGRQKEHLRLEAHGASEECLSGVFFRAPETLTPQPNTPSDLLLRLTLNRFRGEEKVEMQLIDMRPAWLGRDPLLNELLRPFEDMLPCRSTEFPCIGVEPVDTSQGLGKENKTPATLRIATTPDVVWRHVMQHWDNQKLGPARWLTASSREEDISGTYELFQQGSVPHLYVTRAFAQCHERALQALGAFERQCIPSITSLEIIQQDPGPIRKRSLLLESLRSKQRTLVYTNSQEAMRRHARQLRAMLPRSLRDKVSVFPLGLTCQERDDILARFKDRNLLVLFLSDASPWSKEMQGVDQVLLAEPCFTIEAYRDLQHLIEPEKLLIAFHTEDWDKNIAYLDTHYPDRKWLGGLYTRLKALSESRTQPLPASPELLGQLLYGRMPKYQEKEKISAGMHIFREIALLEVFKNEESGYIEITTPTEKRDLNDSCLYSEGKDARHALAQLRCNFPL